MQITNGTRLFIGTRVASKSTVSYNDYVQQDGYWREVGGLISIGGIGDTIELIAQPSIGMERQLRVKGTRSGNQATYQFIRNKLDDGQNALIDAGEECGTYAFKVENLKCGDEDPSVLFFFAEVSPMTFSGGGSNDVQLCEVSLYNRSNQAGSLDQNFNASSYIALADIAHNPADLTSVFTTSAGTTPAVPGDPVGLILDISKMGGKTAGAYMAANGISDPTTCPGKHYKQTTAGARPILARMPKSGIRNRFTVASATLASTTVAVTAVSWVLSFKGTGSVALSGAHTGNLVGSGVSNRVQVAFTPTAGTLTLTITGSVTDAQIEIGSVATPYQRVANVYDVTEEGVPSVYALVGDGLSKCMVSDAVTPNSDKMTVVAGVRKRSDAIAGMVLEHSANYGANGGSFMLRAPYTAGDASYSYNTRGDGTGSLARVINFASPNTAVLTGIGDIGNDICLLRVNGAQLAQSGTDQGTGNYGNRQLFLMARNQALMFFNGYWFGDHISWKNHAANVLAFIEQQMAKNTMQVAL